MPTGATVAIDGVRTHRACGRRGGRFASKHRQRDVSKAAGTVWGCPL